MNILIIGANSGLGLEIFKILKKNKRNNFFLISKNIDKIKTFKYIKVYKCNLKNISSLKKICDKISKDSKNKIDLIICNSAQGTFGRIDNIEFKDYLNDLNVNFFSHLLIIKNFLPGMIKRKKGHVVNIASGAGVYGFKNSSSYSIGKSSTQILIEAIYEENKFNNIHAKNIFPGLTKTNFQFKNKYLIKNFKPKSLGKDKSDIAKKIVKNIFSKKLNIFCQPITKVVFLIKLFPIINTLRNYFLTR